MTLDNLRIEIDKIDQEMKNLFERRMEIAVKVAETKAKTGDKILKPEREETIINRLTEGMDDSIRTLYTSFIKKMMEVSRSRQYAKMLELKDNFRIALETEVPDINRVCYQGLPSSYSQITTEKMFADCESYPVETFEDVFREIDEERAQLGILPINNTTAGSINEVFDLLLKYDLYINYSYIYSIDHCLAGVAGSTLEEIQGVYSHPQALLQCSEFIKERGFTPIEASNTAVAAKLVSEKGDQQTGAICSIEAAEKYRLTVLAQGINHNKSNATKFVAVSKKLVVNENHDRASIVFACSHTSGSLASVLSMFNDYGINLTEIHSRPNLKNPWEYIFYVDFAGNLMDANIKALFYQLSEELPLMKISGSYHSGKYQ